ncbi:hypothetical protein [Actinomadura sp. HBU206391]|uniref:hypothetical protein n=1 Tax=Actinomadura sp. HBU206391 TaxID=2731692 RepID=UPI001C9BBDBF|nr:hypothetical protein [Actinomadura sp. HBU206391]
MESSSPRAEIPDAAAARAALDGVADARARVADRITIPWWYHVGLGAAIAFALVSMSLRFASFGVPLLTLVVLGLGWAVKRSTGISFDPYTATPTARRLSVAWALAGLVVAAIGMYLEWGAEVRYAIAVGGVLIGVMTIVVGLRIDQAVQQDLRADHERAGL